MRLLTRSRVIVGQEIPAYALKKTRKTLEKSAPATVQIPFKSLGKIPYRPLPSLPPLAIVEL